MPKSRFYLVTTAFGQCRGSEKHLRGTVGPIKISIEQTYTRSQPHRRVASKAGAAHEEPRPPLEPMLGELITKRR